MWSTSSRRRQAGLHLVGRAWANSHARFARGDCVQHAMSERLCSRSCAESVTNEEQKNKSDREQQRKAMTDSVGPYIPIYAHRAKCLLTRPTAKKAAQPFTNRQRRRLRIRATMVRAGSGTCVGWRRCATTARGSWNGPGTGSRRRGSAPAAAGDGDVIVWATMARRLITDRRYRDEAMEIIDRAAQTSTTRLQRALELFGLLLDPPRSRMSMRRILPPSSKQRRRRLPA